MIDFFIEILSIISFALTECFLWNDSLPDPGIYILPRGAITIGKMTIGQRGTSMTIIKDFMIGKALFHYSKLEPLIKNCKLVVAVNNNDESQVKALLKNKEICSVLYQNCTFKIWQGYSYVDTLWFLDLSKNADKKKKQVLQLLWIAIKLTKKQ